MRQNIRIIKIILKFEKYVVYRSVVPNAQF